MFGLPNIVSVQLLVKRGSRTWPVSKHAWHWRVLERRHAIDVVQISQSLFIVGGTLEDVLEISVLAALVQPFKRYNVGPATQGHNCTSFIGSGGHKVDEPDLR